MDLFSYELIGSVLSDVAILILLPSVAEFCCLILYWNWEEGSESRAVFNFCQVGFAIF